LKIPELQKEYSSEPIEPIKPFSLTLEEKAYYEQYGISYAREAANAVFKIPKPFRNLTYFYTMC